MDFTTLSTEMAADEKRVRTRFAPSPTGSLHIGGLRTALMCYIIAKRFGGDFVLRIEDTDQKRYVEGAVEGITKGLEYFGIAPDESPDKPGEYGPYVQSERADIYWEELSKLGDYAYKCYMSEDHLELLKKGGEKNIAVVVDAYHEEMKEYSYEQIEKTIKSGIKNSRWFRAWPANENVVLRPLKGAEPVWRFAAPYHGRTTWKEPNGKKYSFANSTINDVVLMKADGLPTYHFAHVVDDNAMKISHVVRGSEWLPSTPLHMAIWKAFGYNIPEYVHLPVILNPNGRGKLSKRSVAEGFFVTTDKIISSGINPDAVLLWLLQNMSILSESELNWRKLIKTFSFSSLPNTKPGAISIGSLNKLITRAGRSDDVNKYVERLNGTSVAEIYDEKVLLVTAEFMRTRNNGLKSYEKYMDFLREDGIIECDDESPIYWQLEVVDSISSSLSAGCSMDEAIDELSSGYGKKAIGVIRYALTHRHISLPVKESYEILGAQRAIERMMEYTNFIIETNKINWTKESTKCITHY